MLGCFLEVKSRSEHDPIIRNMIFHRFLIDSTPFRSHIFAKNGIFTIMRYFEKFQYFGPEIVYVGGA